MSTHMCSKLLLMNIINKNGLLLFGDLHHHVAQVHVHDTHKQLLITWCITWYYYMLFVHCSCAGNLLHLVYLATAHWIQVWIIISFYLHFTYIFNTAGYTGKLKHNCKRTDIFSATAAPWLGITPSLTNSILCDPIFSMDIKPNGWIFLNSSSNWGN